MCLLKAKSRLISCVFRGILFGVLACTLLAIPVLAIDDPNTPPSINAVYVFEDLLETDDVGVLIDYYLDYDLDPDEDPDIVDIPDETVTEAYLAIFIDTDGSTQLKSVAPYTFVNSGYGRGLVWIYFSAAEVTEYSIDSANEDDYRIWLTGNPTLDWAGDPPKTISTIDQWNTTGDQAVLLALRVLYYADQLELLWELDMVESTALGNRLTSTGEEYFENVIQYLRQMAPACFSSAMIEPDVEDLDYTTEFGATATGAIVVGSPVTLDEGDNTVNVNATGTFTVTLLQGTVGTVTSGDATVTGSPLSIVAGDNTVTISAAPTPPDDVTITVALEDTTSAMVDSIEGTGWDLTDAATAFGFSRWMFSGLVWLLVTVLVCAAVYRVSPSQYGGSSAGKVLFPVFIVCIIGGTLLGLLKPVVGITMFIGIAGFFVGYILLFRQASV